MVELDPQYILMVIASTLVATGHFTTFLGIWILVKRANNKDIQVITSQATNIAKKGLAEDLSGLIGNTSNLLSSLNEMVQTVKGSGTFLCLLGSGQIIVAILLLTAIIQ